MSEKLQKQLINNIKSYLHRNMPSKWRPKNSTTHAREKSTSVSTFFRPTAWRSLKFAYLSSVNTTDHSCTSIRLCTCLAHFPTIKSNVPGPKPHYVWFQALRRGSRPARAFLGKAEKTPCHVARVVYVWFRPSKSIAC